MKTATKNLLFKTGLILFFAALIFSCGDPYPYFNQPQPVNARNLKKFPKELQGSWITEVNDKKCTITISKDTYINVFYPSDEFEVPASEMDTSHSFRFINNKLIYVGGIDMYNSEFEYDLRNDTFYCSGRMINTLQLSDSVLLRKANDCYVCNIKRGAAWEVITLSPGVEETGVYIFYYASELKKNQEKYQVRYDSLFAFHPESSWVGETDTIFYFDAAFNKEFFKNNLHNDDLFMLRYTLKRDSTYADHFYNESVES